jgi:hypothetical protein
VVDDVSRFVVLRETFEGRLHDEAASKRLVATIRRRQKEEREAPSNAVSAVRAEAT